MSDIYKRLANLPKEKQEQLLRKLRERGGQAPQQEIPRQPRTISSFPLSFAQQRLWFLDQLEPGSPLYNMPAAVRLEGVLDLGALERSFGELVRRHEALRTTFRNDEGTPVQVISPPFTPRLEVKDLRALPAQTREQEALRLMHEEARRSFDLAHGPLLRVLLFQLGDQEHLLLLAMHHIVSDGWSMGILIREMAALYRGFSTGKALPLPDPSHQYADYATWQRDWLKGEVLEAQLAYWRKQLAGSEQPLELPTDRLRPAVQTHRGALQPVRLSPRVSASLKELAKKEGITPFMLLLAAFQTLLHRYTGQEAISVGSPIAGRSRGELEGIIGFFVNTLVLRTRLEGNPTFRELLARVREVTQGAYDHQDVPFEKLVDELQPERNLSRSPLFQVMLSFQNAQTPALDMPGLSLRELEVDSQAAKFDLSLVMADGPEGFSGGLEYNVDLFEATTAARFAGHLVCLLEGIAAAPDTRLSQLPLLPEAERHQVLVEWNATRTEFPRDTTLHALFEAEVARRPDAVAVEDARERLTYRELDARANQLAWYLRREGVGPDVRVCLCVDRSPELIISLLAILKAGGAYVPLDSTYPRERLVSMVEDARPQVLVTTRRYLEALPTQGAKVVLLDEAREDIVREPTHAPQSGASARNLAYIDFTSGSTGRPKGVCIEHRSVARLVRGVDYADLGEGHTFLLIAPISFDASTLEVWGCLLNGGRLVLFPAHAPGDVKELEELLARHQVTTLHLTAGLFTQMVDANLEGLRPVKQLLTGGDVVSAPHVRRTLEELRIPVTACYGPTESTTFASCFRMTRSEQVGNSVPIGRPIGNTQIYILDRHQHPLPAGMPGELYIGGDGLARGYLELPELTAEKFLPNPFSSEPGARMYRTGDLARFRPDGVLEFLGRIDSQVKIRGFRVELSEVETALLGHPEVREAVVVARQDTGSHKRLVAYVAAPKTLGATELRGFLKEKLPEYMVPSAFVCLEALPLTANGKVDRKALPAPESVRAAEDRPYVAPRNATEQTLAGIWAKVLGVERVGIHDNFFELGGDSIVSLQVIARARQAGLALSPKQLFQRQTIAELAPVVGEARAPAGEQGVVKGPVPLTPIQRAFLESAQPEPHHFNQAVLIEVRERLDAALLERALQRLVEHHDVLRMRFTREGSGWEQHNTGLERSLVLRRVDLSGVTDAELPSAIEAAGAKEQRGLELTEGLLLRAVLMDLGPARPARLLLIIHHLVVDTVSWRTLLEDLSTACVQLRRGEAVAFPPKSTSFKAWAGQIQEYARSEKLGRELERWVEECSPTGHALPVDGPGGANTLASARGLTVELEVEETRALLQEVPAAWRARTDEVLLAALALGFQRWTGGSELRVELEGHGREDLFPGVDLSRTVGWFTSVYPVRLKAPTDASPGDVLRAVRDSLRQVPDRGIGYGLLRYLGEGEAVERLRAMPRAEVAFNYLGQFDGTAAQASSLFTLAREPSGPAASEHGLRTHLLEVNGLVLEGRLRLTFGYSENLHTRATVEALAQGYLGALRELISQRTSADALRYTPADFPLARLERETLARVLPPGEPVEDVYPLSPMQQGLLFHALLSPGTGVYLVQSSWSFHSPLDTAVFQRAWAALVQRHAILRTSFRWEGLNEPVQVVHARPELPWQELDWRGLSETEQRARLETFLAEDRARGFELSRAPLMRVAVMRLAEGVHHIVWTHHHLLLDGWSLGLIFKDLFAFYETFARGEQPTVASAPRYREYIAWVGKQDFAQTEAWWRQTLAGFPMPTPMPGDGTPDAKRGELDHQERRVQFTAATTAALQSFARQHQVTLNTLVQAAWGLVLARYSGERDVIFGATVSGRPPDLEGAEEMMGLFINTLPVRVQLRPGDTVVTWLQRFQAQQLEMRQYEHSPLVQVQTWSEVPRGLPLFDSILVFENLPVDTAVKERSSTLDVRDFDAFERFTFPLNLTAVPGRELLIKMAAKTERFTADLAGQLLGHMKVLLEGFLAHPAQEPLSLPMLT
ncbi:MAG TPA: amino acid adenylation domain-containing protein, partial [Archangium sp.]|uniref:amino acid adenylation domain-containing protein n=1 Tax=Archangium sp. TaxID=1872627 RepID=UPI002EDA34A1